MVSTKDLKTQQAMLRLEQVDRGMKEFQKLPLFKMFEKNVTQDALDAAKKGDFSKVKQAWFDTVPKNENQQKPKPRENVGERQRDLQRQNVEKQNGPVRET